MQKTSIQRLAATARGACTSTPIALIGLPNFAYGQEGLTPAAALPRDLTALGMFLNADPLVKAVLIALLLASVITWTVWVAKTIELFTARRRIRAAFATLASARSLAEAAHLLRDRTGPAPSLVQSAAAELKLSDEAGPGMDRGGIKERVASRLERIEASHGRRLMRGTGVLATIGATAPFVGLFGTVWGIMNSFIGISKSQTTNLAIVAPGIAEALLATAFGLAAAIPAVVIYNLFSRRIAAQRSLLADASAEVLRIVSRDLDRSAAAPPISARRPVVMSAVE